MTAPCSGPAIDYVGDCEDNELQPLRNEIAVTRLRSAGLAIRRGGSSVDVFIAPMRCGFRRTTLHELGHALGLEHRGRLGDLMYQGFRGCESWVEPNDVEVAAILEGRIEGE